MNETIWIHPEPTDESRRLAKNLGISEEIAQILVNRHICDVESARSFLFGTLQDLIDPFLMSGMDAAVSRIRAAIENGEKIMIFGDYDVDGILSVVTLTKALESLGGQVEYFIPERLKEGYGIKREYVDRVQEKACALVISVDCGIKAVDFTREARARGIDVIITDHHQPGEQLPQALSILNPKLDSSRYPDKNLAGIGVAFKLIQALLEGAGKAELLLHYLKMVSIGTVADVVSLRGENRLFVKYGLEALANVSNPGLISLMDVCGLDRSRVSVGDVGFRIAPRINAAGRMGMTDLAVRLFLTRVPGEGTTLAGTLNRLNTDRQKVEEKIFKQALRRIEEGALHNRYKILILGCEQWHRGVIGIVASKLKDLYHRPVLMFAYRNGKAFGSGRSIRGFSLIECLKNNQDRLENFGGHIQAVGCELSCEDMDGFKQDVNAYADTHICDEDLKRKIPIDAEILFDRIDSEFLEKLALLSPFGMGNPRPLFLSRGAEVIAPPRKLKQKHCKFLLRQSGRVFEALGWGQGEWADRVSKGDRIDLVFSVQISRFQGQEKVNLNLEDIR